MSNRVTLGQLTDMPVGQIAALPPDWLAMLQDDAETEAKALKARADLLGAALELRYGDRAKAQLVADGKDAGTARIGDGDFVAVVDLPKRVSWDQDGLRAAVDQVRSWGSDPKEFVTTKLDVAEHSYNAWPSEIRAVFTPARTVATGKAKIKLEPAKKGGA